MDFLKQKWTYLFSTLDVNHDGVVTQADVQQALRDFPTIEGLSEKEGLIADGIIEHWWNTYILKGRKKISEKDFLSDLEREYLEDKTKFQQTWRKCGEEIVGVIDADHDNEISVDNYVKAFKTWGHDNEALLRKSFELYKPEHGKVPAKEYLDDWMIFICNDDPEVNDCVFETFKKGI